MRSAVSIALGLSFLLSLSALQPAHAVTPGEVQQAQRKAKVGRWTIKTGRVMLNTTAGVAAGIFSAHTMAKYGIQMDPLLFRAAVGASAYAGNETCKAITGRIFRRFLAKHEGPQTFAESMVPEKLRHKVVGALGAAVTGVFYEPILFSQWLGKVFAQWSANPRKKESGPEGAAYKSWLSGRVNEMLAKKGHASPSSEAISSKP